MNWLAHILLSEPSAAFRIGNVLPDMAPRSELALLPEPFQRGIRQHYRIDGFTDSHEVVKRSIGRIGPSYRRYGGILIDLFFDYCLTRDWESYCDTPLKTFAQRFYEDVESQREWIPPSARVRLERMRSVDLLCAYGDLDGVREALNRVGSQLRRPLDLGKAVTELEQVQEPLRNDFREFFPQLQKFVTAS
jgi:acyl carrier protein phosphodiesterase